MRYKQPPSGPFVADLGNPLVEGIAALVLPGLGADATNANKSIYKVGADVTQRATSSVGQTARWVSPTSGVSAIRVSGPKLDVSDKFSGVALIRISAYSGDSGTILVSSDGTSFGEFQFRVSSTGKLQVCAPGSAVLATGNATLSLNTLYVVGYTVIAGQIIKLYTNGVQDGPDFSISGRTFPSVSPWSIGGHNLSNVNFIGDIAMVAVYEGRLLQPQEHLALGRSIDAPWQLFARRAPVLALGAPGGTVALTGAAASGTVGSVGATVAGSAAVTGTSATGQVGTVGLTVSATRALTGNAATGQVGTLTPSVSTNLALTGNASTGQVGTVGVSVDATRALTGVAGTGAVGSVSVSVAVAISGNVATGAVGTVTPNTGTVVALTGTPATGAAGTVAGSVAVSTALSGVSGSGQIGSVAATSGSALALTGIAANGAVGNVTASATATAAITGVSAAGAVGDVVVGGNKTVALSGVSAAGGVGNVSILSGLGGAEWKKQRRNKFYREEHEFQVRQEAEEAVEAARTRVIAPVKQMAQVIAKPAFDDEDEEELMLLL